MSVATVCFAYLLPKGNAKLSEKLMRSMAPGSRVVTYVFRLPKEHWDEHLETCKAVASTRDRGRGRVDTSGFNKIFQITCQRRGPNGARVDEPPRTVVSRASSRLNQGGRREGDDGRGAFVRSWCVLVWKLGQTK